MTVDNNLKDSYWKLLQSRVQEQRIEKIFDIFRVAGFEPILIKGWGAARNYPRPFERLAADIDIAVSPLDYSGCQKVLKQQPIVGIDLHNGLRHLDTVAWDDLFDNSQLVKLNKTAVRILCPEDHLRILCVHWLADGGVSKERLWDIVYAVANRPSDFDWERCLKTVSETRREWILCTIGLAVKYLGLELNNTPMVGRVENFPKWLIKTVEKEWENKVRLKPLHHCLNNRQEFFEQLRQRIPPNPIQATVEMEGKFDEKPRIFYQIGSVLLRFMPSVKRISETFWQERIGRQK